MHRLRIAHQITKVDKAGRRATNEDAHRSIERSQGQGIHHGIQMGTHKSPAGRPIDQDESGSDEPPKNT